MNQVILLVSNTTVNLLERLRITVFIFCTIELVSIMDKIVSQVQIPYLSSLTAQACSKFRESAEAYVARGGEIPLRQLVSSVLKSIISLKVADLDWKGIENDEFLAVLAKIHAPKSKLDAMARFKSISMKGPKSQPIDPEAVLSYAVSFMDLNAQLEESCRPDEKYLVKMFINQLKPWELREAVSMESPKSVDEAVSATIDQSETLFSQQSLSDLSKDKNPSDKDSHGGSKPSGGGGVRTHKIKGEPKGAPPSQSPDKHIKCYGCGEEGHIKPKCPNRDKWRKTAAVKSLHSPEMVSRERPHVEAVLVCTGDVQKQVSTVALLDSGSDVCILHPNVRDQLLQKGFECTTVNRKIATGNQPFIARQLISADVKLFVDGSWQIYPLQAYVHDCGEQLILSWNFMTQHNLRKLLLCPSTTHDLQCDADDTLDIPPKVYQVIHWEYPELDEKHAKIKEQFQNVLSGGITSTNSAIPPFKIELETGKTLKSHPPRKLSPVIRRAVLDKIAELECLGIVRKSMSKHAAQIVMVKNGHKQDNSYRMCVDYRLLNSITKDLQFPLQNMQSVLQRLSGKKYFATLDLSKSFHQIPMDTDSISLTAFSTPDGLYEYVTMPFGLKNASRYFQKVISDILGNLLGVSCEVFIDDIVIYGDDEQSYLKNLATVLQRLTDYGLILNGEKCQFGLRQIEYLGHIVNEKGITLADSRRAALRDMHTPVNTSQLRSFMGCANYFRRFIPNYAVLAKPLTKLCSDKVPFTWGPEQEISFNALKDAAVNSDILYFPQSNMILIVRTDASILGVGGMLLHIDNSGKELPIAYAGKAFNTTEQKWSTYEQEAFGVFYCISQFAHFLKAEKFLVQTDHRNLSFIAKSQTPKVVRWRLALQDYNFTVDHYPGKLNVVADAISRLHPESGSALILHHDQRSAFEAVHNSVVGHRGVFKTIQLMQKHGVVDKIEQSQVNQWISQCAICQKIRLRQPKFHQALETTATAQPFTSYTIDTVGPFAADAAGNQYLLVCVDNFTRFVELIPTVHASAKCAAKALLQIFGRYGMPKMMQSDQGTQFTAKLITEFCNLLQVTQRFSIPYRPQSQGKVERVNQEVVRHLRSILIGSIKKESWSDYIPIVQRIVNATPCAATGYPPSKLLYGDAIDLDSQLVHVPDNSDIVKDFSDFNLELIAAQQHYAQKSKDHQQMVIDKYLDKSPPNPTTFHVNDLVLVQVPTHEKHSKIRSVWNGPMTITKVNGNAYTCQNLISLEEKQFHVERLKIYKPDPHVSDKEAALWDSKEYIIDEIIDHQPGPTKAKWKFLVRWLDYGVDDDSWEPFVNVKHTSQFAKYIRQHRLKPFPPHKFPLPII